MSMIIDITEVNSQKDLSEKTRSISNNDSDTSKVSKCDNQEEIHNQGNKKNIDRKKICNTTLSNNNIDDDCEKLQISGTSNLVDNNYLGTGIDLNKKDKLKTDDTSVNKDNDNDITEKKWSRGFLDLIDSDSEKESNNSKTLSDKSIHASFKCLQVAKNKKTFKNKRIRKIDNESENDSQTSNTDDFSKKIHKTVSTNVKNNQSPIYSKSKGKEASHKFVDIFDNANIVEKKNIKEKSIKKWKGSIRASKNKAMHQIHSESQRLLRERKISLPYHKPKQRTLQEFLNRTQMPILPKAPSMAAKLKMSTEIINQVVTKRLKEVKDFFKSDSEDEIQEFTDKNSTNKDIKHSSVKNKKISPLIIENSFIQDHKKIDQDSYVKEIIDTDCKQQNQLKSKSQIDASTEKCQIPDGHVLGLPLPIFTNGTISDKDKLLPKYVDHKVTLKGSPGTIIDLTHNIKPNRKGIDALLDRFFSKHVIKKQTDDKSEIIHLQDTQNGPVPIKEIFPYKLSTNIDNSELNKPGAKLKHLKENLESLMMLKRNERWKQKQIEQEIEEKKKWDKEDENDYDLHEEKRNNNFELTDSKESEENEEPEENDIYIKDKKRKKYLFADDEAKVTDEDSDISIEETGNESSTDEMKHSNKQFINIKYRKKYMDNGSERKSDQEEEEDKDLDLDADIEDESESDSQDTNKINVRKNIVKNKKNRIKKQLMREFKDISVIDLNDLENRTNQIKNVMTDIDTFMQHSKNSGWINESECSTSACQQNTEVYTKNQICKTPLVKTSMLDFVSPITQLSVLNTTLDSNKKDSLEKNEYLTDKRESNSMENTQHNESFEYMTDIRNKTILKKRLFDDIEETIDDEYLMKLCSGKFESKHSTNLDLKDPCLHLDIIESQLPVLCSTNLNTKSANVKQLKALETDNETFQHIKLMTTEDFSKPMNYTEREKEISVVDLKLKVVSSDDDQSDDADTFFKPKRRSMKKAILPDSEEEEKEEQEEESTDSYDEENDNADNENAEQYIDYDSEENEIIVPKNNIKKIAADFLEEEAELSGSDYNSADEDEKDSDNLEFEEGDNEYIDEHKVKDELGKIHMKQMLDEDKRKVRLLKELLFEDGDLHSDGMGRERKFKWRNIDKLEDNNEIPQVFNENDGWVDMQENEERAKWIKFKRERDKFLEEREKCSNNDIKDDLQDSKIFKSGLKAPKKIENSKSKNQDVSSDKIDPLENVEPIMPQSIRDLLDGSIIGRSRQSQTIHNIMKKRSFLARGEESLARLASLAKQSDSISHTVNTRNFVFQYIDPHTNNVSKKEEKTREEKNTELQNKPYKRKSTSDFSLAKKRRK